MNISVHPGRLRAALVAAALVTAHAVAEPVPDPTRPMGLAEPEPRAAKTPRATTAAAAPAAPAALPRLQSVQVAGTARHSSALVDGRLVRVGDRIGEHSVAAIDRDGITLRSARGEQRLPLLTGVTQTASRASPPTTDTLANGSPQDKRP